MDDFIRNRYAIFQFCIESLGGVLKFVRICQNSFVPTQYCYFLKPRRSPPLEILSRNTSRNTFQKQFQKYFPEILLEILSKTKKIAPRNTQYENNTQQQLYFYNFFCQAHFNSSPTFICSALSSWLKDPSCQTPKPRLGRRPF